ncbi:MAG: hypothetical protein ACREEH_02670, partial [Caulobacteraceae bacterium]
VAPHRFAPRFLPEFVLGQIGLLNPLIALFLGLSIASAKARERLGAFLLSSAPFGAYLLLHSLHDRVEAHWPAPLYPALAIAAAAGAEEARGMWAKLRALAPILGFCLAATALLWTARPVGAIPIGGDPAELLRGWRGFSAAVEAKREAAGAAWVGTADYGLAAELAASGKMRAPVAEVIDRARWRGLRIGPPPDLSRPGLLVDLPRRLEALDLASCFARVAPMGAIGRGADPGKDGIYKALEVFGAKPNLMETGCSRARKGGG